MSADLDSIAAQLDDILAAVLSVNELLKYQLKICGTGLVPNVDAIV